MSIRHLHQLLDFVQVYMILSSSGIPDSVQLLKNSIWKHRFSGSIHYRKHSLMIIHGNKDNLHYKQTYYYWYEHSFSSHFGQPNNISDILH